MSNSKLVNYKKLSPNHSGKRTHKIDRITPHCVVGQCSVETLGSIFMDRNREASCNYGIGTDGRVLLCVEEKNRSWCSSSNANDQRAITIECASDTYTPYAMNSKVYNKLIKLCIDICKRNKKKKLLWFKDKNKSLSYKPKPDEMVLQFTAGLQTNPAPATGYTADWEMLQRRLQKHSTPLPKAKKPPQKNPLTPLPVKSSTANGATAQTEKSDLPKQATITTPYRKESMNF